METLNLILALCGIIPTIVLVIHLTKRYVLGEISWNEVYSKINLFVQTFQRDHGMEPSTVITLGYGGTIIGSYLAQFFPNSQFIHIPLVRDAKTGIRELNRQSLNYTHPGMILIVSGFHETGLSLSSVIDNLHNLEFHDNVIQSYAFLKLPYVQNLEEHDHLRVEVNYYSISRKKVKLPWYTARSPSTNAISRLNKGFSLMLPKNLANIKNLSLDFSQSKERIDLQSQQLMKIIAEYIISAASKKNKYYVIIGGPGAIGKTEFAKSLCNKISDSTYLSLDSSIMETSKRDLVQLDGYKFEAYNIQLVNQWLNLLNEEIDFEISPYDHSIRKCNGIRQVKADSKIRIIEWVFALDKRVEMQKDLIIVIDAPDNARYNYLLERATNIQNKSINDSTLDSIRQRFNHTNEQINPTLLSFDVRFILDLDKHISRIDSNIPELNRLLQDTF